MTQQPNKPTVAVDLDGVLAQYEGWKGVDHIGEPIEGAREFLAALQEHYRVVIHTTRSNSALNARHNTVDLTWLVEQWLGKHSMPYDEVYSGGKPLAVAYIDDRAIRCVPQREMPQIAYHSALAMLAYERRVTGHEWGDAQVEAAKRGV